MPPVIIIAGEELIAARCPTCGTRCHPPDLVSVCVARHKAISRSLKVQPEGRDAETKARIYGKSLWINRKPVPRRSEAIEYNEYLTGRTYHWGGR